MRIPATSGWLLLIAGLAGCGGGGSGEVIVLDPGDGLPVESFHGIDIADIDADGRPDIVAASRHFDGASTSETRLNVFLQDAGNPGTFPARTITVHSEGADIWHVAAGDLTLDGLPEVLIKSISFDGFALFAFDPATEGQLLPPARFGESAGFRPEFSDQFAIGDVNGDLYPDLVVSAGKELVLFLQDPAAPGEFVDQGVFAEGAEDVLIKDMNGDGLVDVVSFMTHPNNDDLEVTDEWRLHLQNSSAPGTFFAPVEYFVEGVGWALGAADLNGDGRVDVAVNSTAGRDQFLTVYEQTAFGGFTARPAIRTSLGGLLGDQAIADLDGDGRPEIIAAMNTAALDPQLIQVYEQDASGDYVPVTLLTVPFQAVGHPFLYTLRVVDLDGDAQPDIVVSTDEIIAFFQVTGSPGQFAPATVIAAQR